jgi:hypothetical protein
VQHKTLALYHLRLIVYLKPALDMAAAFWIPTFWIGLFKCILQAN